MFLETAPKRIKAIFSEFADLEIMGTFPKLGIVRIYTDPVETWLTITEQSIQKRYSETWTTEWAKKINPCRLNKGFSAKFPEDYLDWWTPEEGRRAHQPKRCYVNKMSALIFGLHKWTHDAHWLYDKPMYNVNTSLYNRQMYNV